MSQPPALRPLDLAVLADVRTHGVRAEQLLRYLHAIRPQVLVLLEQPAPPCGRRVHRGIAARLRQLTTTGTRLYYVSTTALPGAPLRACLPAGATRFRTALTLRVGGQRYRFLLQPPPAFARPAAPFAQLAALTGLQNWWLRLVGRPTGTDTGAPLAGLVCGGAVAPRVTRGPGAVQYRPGSWHHHGTSLELAEGEWHWYTTRATHSLVPVGRSVPGRLVAPARRGAGSH